MFKTLVLRIIPVRDEEVPALLLATLYGFCIFVSYNILRPVRDEISATDRGNLQVLWTVVFLVMLVAVPLYSAAVARFSRGVFIPLANRFFIANLLIFYAVLRLLPGAGARIWIDRVFYVWTSVFALFVVTVFWGFIADLFRNEQGKRLFGFITVGASLGGIVGGFVTGQLAELVPVFSLILVAIVPLEIAAQIARLLHRRASRAGAALREEGDERIRGTAFSGIRTVFRSPYLMQIAGYIALMTFASTILYYQQANLIADVFDDRGASRAFLGNLNGVTQTLTVLTQGFLTAHVIRKIGIAWSLAVIPVVTALGFSSLGVYPLLTVFVVFSVIYNAGRYAIAKPSREVLFTVVSREERYKSKAFIDAAVYRGGDLMSGWTYAGLSAIGFSLGAIALVAVPIALLWAGTGFLLGRRQESLVAQADRAARPEGAPALAAAKS